MNTRLKNFISYMGMTQTEVAKAVGLSKYHFNRILNHKELGRAKEEYYMQKVINYLYREDDPYTIMLDVSQSMMKSIERRMKATGETSLVDYIISLIVYDLYV